MFKLITRSALLLLCAGSLTSCTTICNVFDSLIMLPFNIINALL